MIKSMTGFGRGEYSDGKRSITVEIKSVNHGHLEMSIRIGLIVVTEVLNLEVNGEVTAHNVSCTLNIL